mmetsp:Transcript_39399/g.102122  ORF Transcript_39399/g.102122 Transcript_39399/m.102122 type:complete len:113 (+) Transcript_39399:256-594(+)
MPAKDVSGWVCEGGGGGGLEGGGPALLVEAVAGGETSAAAASEAAAAGAVLPQPSAPPKEVESSPQRRKSRGLGRSRPQLSSWSAPNSSMEQKVCQEYLWESLADSLGIISG